MSEVVTLHRALLNHLRTSATESERADLGAQIAQLTDDSLLRRMFVNYRGSGEPPSRQLTRFGLQVMRAFFAGYEASLPAGTRVLPRHILYLSRQTRLPFFCGDDLCVVYDQQLGVMLRLAGGQLDRLLELDTE